MNSAPGVWYGLAFVIVLFGGLSLVFSARSRAERAAWEKAHPRVPGSGAQLLRRLEALAQPTLLLVPATSPGFSKLGGLPELPPGVDWPVGSKGPREFLGQMDLAEVSALAPIPWLPAEGLLYAFFDREAYGAPDLIQIVYSLARSGAPLSLPDSGAPRVERRVAFSRFTSFPSPEWLNYEGRIDLDFEEFDAQLDMLGQRPPGENLLHRIGGFPDELQNGCLRLECEQLASGLPALDYRSEPSPAIEHASQEWRLVLQIDSDPGLKMEFGDAGRLYVFVREKDARAADFSRTVTLFQSY